jgi:hypothetical protein
MVRATLISASDQPDEIAAMESWLAGWSQCLSYISDEQGCGCCIHMLDVEGPQEAIDAIPDLIRATSDWSLKIKHDP